MSISFRTKVDWRDTVVRARVYAGSMEATYTAARAILTEANKTVPYETGRLKNSGKVTPARNPSGPGSSAMVSYNTPYAARLHENPQYNFKGKGRGKWLQLAVQEMRYRIATIMAEVMARRLRG